MNVPLDRSYDGRPSFRVPRDLRRDLTRDQEGLRS